MATTALSATQPKCLPRSAQALAPAADANITAVVATIQCRAGSDAIHGAAIRSTPPPIHATVPACHTARISVRSRGGSMVARANTFVSPSTPWISATTIAAAPEHCSSRSRIGFPPYITVWSYAPALAPVNTVVYGTVVAGDGIMAEQLSAEDWLDLGLKTLAKSGFTALKAEPLAKAMGVSRGSFYWHFADIGAYHAAILKHWREVAAEQVIAGLEAASEHDNPLLLLLRRTFSGKLAVDNAVRTWPTLDPVARAAVQATDRRRLSYVQSLFERSGLSPGVARSRAQIFYWAFLGYALSDQPLPKARQRAVLQELQRMALR